MLLTSLPPSRQPSPALRAASPEGRGVNGAQTPSGRARNAVLARIAHSLPSRALDPPSFPSHFLHYPLL